MTDAVPAWAQSDEQHPEREAEWRALATSLSESDIIIQGLTGKVAEYEMRAEYNAELVTEARAQLAALREAAKAVLGCKAREYTKEERALRAALSDTAEAARAHDEMVQQGAFADGWLTCADECAVMYDLVADEANVAAAAQREASNLRDTVAAIRADKGATPIARALHAARAEGHAAGFAEARALTPEQSSAHTKTSSAQTAERCVKCLGSRRVLDCRGNDDQCPWCSPAEEVVVDVPRIVTTGAKGGPMGGHQGVRAPVQAAPPIDRELARALVRAGSYSAKPLVGDEETDHVVGVVLAERAR